MNSAWNQECSVEMPRSSFSPRRRAFRRVTPVAPATFISRFSAHSAARNVPSDRRDGVSLRWISDWPAPIFGEFRAREYKPRMSGRVLRPSGFAGGSAAESSPCQLLGVPEIAAVRTAEGIHRLAAQHHNLDVGLAPVLTLGREPRVDCPSRVAEGPEAADPDALAPVIDDEVVLRVSPTPARSHGQFCAMYLAGPARRNG